MLADFSNELAAVERLVELRKVRDQAQEWVDQLGDVHGREILELVGDWGPWRGAMPPPGSLMVALPYPPYQPALTTTPSAAARIGVPSSAP